MQTNIWELPGAPLPAKLCFCLPSPPKAKTKKLLGEGSRKRESSGDLDSLYGSVWMK